MKSVPSLTTKQIDSVSRLVSDYITANREKYRSRATRLSERQKAPLAAFFIPELLRSVRVIVLQEERIGNPDFYPTLKKMGINNPPDQSTMAAITFCNVVASHEPFSDGLLFHELVHVEQYRQLGIARFSELYVRGFLSGGSYEAIPLEVNAYTLEDLFESDHDHAFSVEDEVRRWADSGQFG